MEIIREQYLLREWRSDDRSSLAHFANNHKIWVNVRDCFPYPYTEEDADFFIEQIASQSPGANLAIVIDGQTVGGIGIVPQSDVERISAEIGYWLAEPYWGRGIMTDAVRTLATHIFDHTEIIRLFAPVFEYNTASMRVLEKCGFRKTGIHRKAAIKDGHIIDLHHYELVK